MNVLRLAVATAAAALTLAAPALAQTPEPPPVVNESFYFKCQEPNKVQNSLLAYAPAWTKTKPATSFTAGAGCGFADTGALQGTSPDNKLYDAAFGGTYDGRIRSFNVELHDLVLTQASTQILPDYKVEVHILADGEALTPADGVETALVPVRSSTGASQSFKFGVQLKKDLEPSEGRQITIGIKSWYSDSAAAWVFGASEVPAGVEFHPTGKLAKPTLTL